VILGDDVDRVASEGAAASGGTTLDDLFRHAVARHPDAPATVDPPNRAAFTDGGPRRLTYAEADRAVSAIAARLRQLGLATDSVVAVQLPNTVEAALTLLGVLRAGLIAAPLPLLWRHADCVAALARTGARAIVTVRRAGATDHCALAMDVAARVFSVRHVCAFGANVPAGVVPLDDVFSRADPPPHRAPRENAAAHVAVVTFEATTAGPVPVARDHLQLLAAGLGPTLESGAPPGARLLAPLALSSLAGLSLAFVPWLLNGGTLVLHAPFDPRLFGAQWREMPCDVAALPGPLVAPMSEAGLLDGTPGTVLALWHGPERSAEPHAGRTARFRRVDAVAFGESGLIAVPRRAGGAAAALPLGVVGAPHASANAVPVAEIARTARHTVGLRGPMVPRFAFPPRRGGGNAFARTGDDGFVDTGVPCRLDRAANALVVTGMPAGLIAVGGYRIALGEMQDLAKSVDRSAVVAAVPDPVLGHRLAASAANQDAVLRRLADAGFNPLALRAFRSPPPTRRAAGA
jgi:acyl-CoA synthetase (AMP-forming)/AMP-acid ligase II